MRRLWNASQRSTEPLRQERAWLAGAEQQKGQCAGRAGRAGRSQAGARSLSLTPSAMEDAPGPSAEKAFGLSCSFVVLL